MPRVTCDLPLQLTPFKPEWKHLSELTLADPNFGEPGRIDILQDQVVYFENFHHRFILLGADIFIRILRQGRQTGVCGSPSVSVFETEFGWVLAGETSICTSNVSVASYHTSSTIFRDQILQCFWEPMGELSGLTPEERMVVHNIQENHQCTESGRFLAHSPS